MDKEKYYTPKVEELHMNMEVELCSPEKMWYKYKITSFDFIQWLAERKSIKYWARIKCLDENDIISLGFKKQEHEITYFVHIYTGVYLWILPDNKIQINPHPYYSGDKTIFNGFIKNKYELCKILEQIDINSYKETRGEI